MQVFIGLAILSPMKEVFLAHNHTLKEDAKTLFEQQWLRSTSQNQNKPARTARRTLLSQGAMSTSGYAYPGFATPVYYIEEDADDTVEE